MRICWIIFCCLLAFITQLVFAQIHAPFPVIAVVTVYISIVFQWRKIIAPALIAGVLFDTTVGRGVPFTPFFVLIASGGGVFIKTMGTHRTSLYLVVAPCVVSGSALVTLSLTNLFPAPVFQTVSWMEALFTRGLFLCSPLLLTPLLILILDGAARRIGVPASR